MAKQAKKVSENLGPMLTVSQFATELGMQQSTIRSWVLKRRIFYKIVNGKSVRIPRTELERIAQPVPALVEAGR